MRNVLLTSSYSGTLGLLFAFLNTIAIAYRSAAALPFGTIVLIVFVWAIVTIPLTIVGGIVGKNTKAGSSALTGGKISSRNPSYLVPIHDPQMCVASSYPSPSTSSSSTSSPRCGVTRCTRFIASYSSPAFSSSSRRSTIR